MGDSKPNSSAKTHHNSPVGLATGEPTKVVIGKHPCIVLEFEDALFHHDSAVLLPLAPKGASSEDEGGATEEQEDLTGLEVIRAVYRYMDANPSRRLVIAGHTDRSGPDAYNFELSELRANSVLYVLLNRKLPWVDTVRDKNTNEDETQLLRHYAARYGWACNPDDVGKVKAIRALQEGCNVETGSKLEADGDWGPLTWGAVFDLYMLELAELMQADDPSGLSKWIHPDRFVDGFKRVVGCGESVPIDTTGLDGIRSQTNRRVEFVFFDTEDGPPPILNCPPPGDEPHPLATCPLYNSACVKHEYIQPGSVGPLPPAREHTVEITKTDSPHFLPEHDELIIDYRINGPLNKIKTLEFVVSTEKEPDKAILEREIEVPEEADGRFSWKGDVTDGDYPGFLTLGQSPYLIQIVLTTRNWEEAKSATKKVELLTHGLEIFVDTPDALGVDAKYDKPVDDLAAEMAAGSGRGRLFYDSSIFKVSSAEMNDDASFTTYEDAWGRGIDVSVLAKVWLKAKDNSKHRSAKLTASAKLLWDVRLENEKEYDTAIKGRGVHSDGRKFLKKATDHERTGTEPPGRTAHVELGGLRAKAADRSSDEKQFVELHSKWKIDEPSTRAWCAYSSCAEITDVGADTGVGFVGGRIAQDAHALTVYLDTDGSLDDADDAKLKTAPAHTRSNTLKITNWRRVDVVQNFKMGSGTRQLDIPALDTEYNKAAMHIRLAPGVTLQDKTAEWKTHYQSVVADMGKTVEFVKDACLPDPGGYPVKYRSFADYWAKTNEDAGFFEKLWMKIKAFFGAVDEETYRKKCDKYAYRIYSRVAKKFPLTQPGLTFFKFSEDGDHNQWKDSYTAGIAPAIPGLTDRNKAVFFVFKKGKGTDTLIHEVGHLLFLAHAPGHFNAGEDPAGFQPDAHDEDQICLMSYHPSKRYLCGLCLLKLSGWDSTEVNSDGSID